MFFTVLSLIFLIVAGVLFIPVLSGYVSTGLVAKFPTLIVSGVMATIGILLWICGVILHVVVKKHRQLYELELSQTAIALSIGDKLNK